MEMTTQKIRTIIHDMIAETFTLINTYDVCIVHFWRSYKLELQKAIELLDKFTDDNVDDIEHGYEMAIHDRCKSLDKSYCRFRAGIFPYPDELRKCVEMQYQMKALKDLLFRIDVNREICDIG